MGTITLQTIGRRKELSRADFLESWADELVAENTPDLFAEAERLRDEVAEIRAYWARH